MALFRYDKTSNKLVPITSEGSVGIPVGAVMTFAEGTTHENWLLCDGRNTTGTAEELQTHYPALYAYLGGSNVLPEIYDESKAKNHLLSEFVSAVGDWTIPYDGTIFLVKGRDSNVDTNVTLTTTLSNGTTTTIRLFATYGYRATIVVKKGDILTIPSGTSISGSFGKQSIYTYSNEPLYIKATSAGIEVDKDLYGTKEYIRDQNILSKWENITIPTGSHTITMQYDGELYFTTGAPGATGGEYVYLYVNGFPFIVGVQPKGGDGNNVSTFIPFTKGDIMYTNKSGNAKVRYYKLRDYTGR